MRFDLVDQLKINKSIIKEYKLGPIGQLELDLIDQPQINQHVFVTLCAVSKLNVAIIDDKIVYLNYVAPYTSKIAIIKRISRHNYKIVTEKASAFDVAELKTKYLIVDGYRFKLKSIGSYTLSALMDLCAKLSIDLSKSESKKMTKQTFYDLIVRYFCDEQIKNKK